jgi:hypothetical protein
MHERLDAERIELQLRRIEQIQEELHRSIMDDRLPGLDSLIEEMGSRLQTLLSGGIPAEDLPQYQERLAQVVGQNEKLESMMQAQLKLVSNRLQKTHDTKQVFELYAGETYKLKQLTKHRLDVDG